MLSHRLLLKPPSLSFIQVYTYSCRYYGLFCLFHDAMGFLWKGCILVGTLSVIPPFFLWQDRGPPDLQTHRAWVFSDRSSQALLTFRLWGGEGRGQGRRGRRGVGGMEFIPIMDRAGCLLALFADPVRISQDLLQSLVPVTPPWSFPSESLLLAASASFFFFAAQHVEF